MDDFDKLWYTVPNKSVIIRLYPSSVSPLHRET